MKNYLRLIRKVLEQGELRQTRNGMTRSTFGHYMSWDLQDGFPLITTKQMKIKSIASELLWILSGSRDERYLAELNGTKTTIWTRNADTYFGEFPGDVGNIYGPLLRNFHGVDQLNKIIDTLRDRPTDRRMLVTMWDPSEHQQCLPTCHFAWQVYVREGQFLDLIWHQRSVDVGLGLPYDIAHYALLTHLLASTVYLEPGRLHCSLGDTHIYESHRMALAKQLDREPMELGTIDINHKDILNVTIHDITIKDYESHPPINLEFIT